MSAAQLRPVIVAAIALLLALSLFVALAQPPVEAEAPDDLRIGVADSPSSPAERYVPGQLIVKFKRGVVDSAIESAKDRLSLHTSYVSPHAAFEVLSIPDTVDVQSTVERLSELPIVRYAEPNRIRQAFWSPDDPLYPLQWHFDQIAMEDAWDMDASSPDYGGDPSVVVAILDTGIAYEDYSPAPGETYLQAPDLAGTSFASGYDFVNSDSHPNDDVFHGTHVCGTVAQTTNNGTGVAGTAFNVTVMPVKVLGPSGGTDQQVADGIYYAVDNGADVINMSLGGPGTSQTLEDAVAYAYNNGVTVICSAGNAYQEGNAPQYPAAYDVYSIAVGATQYDQTRAYYSNTGSYIDIVAPGGNVSVDQNGDGYGDGVLQQTFNPTTMDPTDFGYWFVQGTSMASPHVAGAAALILAEHPTWTPDMIREALESTATDLGAAGRDNEFGWGLLNAPAAVSWMPLVPPDVDTSAATDIACDCCMLNGNLGDMGTASSTDVAFEWATDDYFTSHGDTYNNETASECMASTGPFCSSLTGLQPGTIYHFRATATGDGTAYGDDMVFVTTAPGDANADGNVNMQDVTSVELMILGFQDITCGADANQDGSVNMGDVTTIELMILGYL